MIIKYNYVVIEGNIGAGKTTLAKMLGREYDAKVILERFEENPFLPKFYENPEKYSFPLELSFLADRYSQLKKDLANRDLFQQQTISDYYFMNHSSLPRIPWHRMNTTCTAISSILFTNGFPNRNFSSICTCRKIS